jgi:hypothetical protein
VNVKRMFRVLALAAFLGGALVAAIPAELTAATCTADSGATCVCAGGCEAEAVYCWCKPPAK